jgi:uroporphyrinogen decarboxylase
MAAMTKFERVTAALRGERVDHVPASLWGHNFLKEWSPEGLAEAMLEFHRAYDWDYMKVNPRASYHAEDWGAKYEPSGNATKSPAFVAGPIKEARDWNKLEELRPDQGVLGQHLKALELIRDGLAGDAPYIQTVFSPLGITKYLAGNRMDVVKSHLREDPVSVHRGLAVIARTFAAFVDRCMSVGVSGIFFATIGWASRDYLTEEEYLTFGKKYDLQVLDALGDRGMFNVLHNCGERIYFELLSQYPVHAINWASTLAGNPSLADGLQMTQKAVMGGISEKTTLLTSTPDQVGAEAREALRQTRGLRFIMAPGCSIPPDSPEANLRAVRIASY